ncbi:tRNA uracil 4-sulfurtransferase ThiI [Proteinivorax hydrogeniformans]|uniref:Probable tRNA sulfurtransferase n=1 Tax=Proteinivorax hydrogeniformans TaxID=1826727 RepID=A0AAU8HWB7_9FIRM
MYDVILVRYGEISLKGRNRSFFINTLIKRMKDSISHLEKRKIESHAGRLYVPVKNDGPQLIEALKKVFGIVSISPAVRVEKDMEKMGKACVTLAKKSIKDTEGVTFKVDCRRSDKTFPMSSMEIGRDLGAAVLREYEHLRVNLTAPQHTIGVEVRDEDSFVYAEKIPGPTGLPIGVTGRGICLLSGGIDSPVAFWLAAKRGIDVEGLHFHSYPFTSQKAKEKVDDLCKDLSKYCGRVRLHTVHFTPIQKAIKLNCDEDMIITIMRRFMFKIGEEVAKRRKALALVTGENVAQVASQTLESMSVINEVVDIPVLRPLVTMDKTEIIDKSHEIGTYETSIRPYEDCCTVFTPQNPKTKPTLEQCIEAEKNLDVEGLVKEAVEGIETEIFRR